MDRPVRILSLDGGGIRGIIPARVLVELEDLAGGPRIGELFDLIAGTSTGGILALGATVPGPDGRPRYGARDLQAVYISSGQHIFPGGGQPTWRQRLLGASGGQDLGADLRNSAQRIGSFFGGNKQYAGNARYFATGLEEVLAAKLESTPMGAATTNVAVTSYDMRSASPVVFRSWLARGHAAPLMRDVARATSAGPTYFPPQALELDGGEAVLVDGGLVANNPGMVAYTDALNLYPGRECMLLSIGTGTKAKASPSDVTYDAIRSRSWLGTARGVMTAAMDGNSALQDQTLSGLLNRPDQPTRYWRIQAELGGCNFAMDDASEANVRCLSGAAERLVDEHRPTLTELVELLRTHA
jgi:patatin-like phospholipase/acyl hydrolase